jgi:hypothetical protein
MKPSLKLYNLYIIIRNKYIKNNFNITFYYKPQTKKTKTIMSKLNTEILNNWTEMYNSKFKLPETKIPCSTDNCEVQTTMFGTNLHERVIKFENIENLLTTFECKTCRAKSKAQALIAKLTAAKN